MKTVLDSNVYISSILTKGAANKVVRMAIQERFTNFVSTEILKEVEEKLLTKFKEPKEKVEAQLALITSFSKIIEPKIKVNVVKRDPDDNKIIECALEANADFIVSNDNDLLNLIKFRKTRIVSSKEFLKILN